MSSNGSKTKTKKAKKKKVGKKKEGKTKTRCDLTADAKKATQPAGTVLMEKITIAAPNLKTVVFHIRGTTPLVQNKFSKKAQEVMRQAQAEGSRSKKGKKHKPKDFDALFHESYHKGVDGSFGFPAAGLRAAMISACRAVGFKMTVAKQTAFVEADCFDADGTGLVKITEGKPRHVEHPVRIQQTTDIRVRAMYDAGWEAKPKLTYDADMFSLTDIANLLMRAGLQVGIGEGRNDSRSSSGCGWGSFEILGL